MSEPVLGIDGGGTRTVAAVGHGDEILGLGYAGPANYQVVGLEQAVREIGLAAERALAAAKVNIGSVVGVWAGLAGLNSRDDARCLRQALGRIWPGVQLECDNDAFNCLESATAGPGVAVIAGTGSIVVGRDDQGATARAGGWGHIMGDEGSGYEVGRMALRAVCRAADGRGPATALARSIMRRLQVSSADGLYRRVYVDGMARHEIAALSREVSRAADEGDEQARLILSRGGQELAVLARTVISRLGLERSRFALVLCGGLFEAGRWLLDPLVEEASRLAPGAEVTRATVQPVIGAVRLAQRVVRR